MKKILNAVLLLMIFMGTLLFGPVTPVKAGLYQDAQILMDFSTTGILVGETSTLKIEINNTNDFWLENVSFTNNLGGYQAGLEVAPAGLISNTCEGVVIAAPGTGIISLSGGMVKPYSSGQGTCAIQVEIIAKVPGSLQNYIPAYGSATTYGGAGLYATGRGGLDIVTNGTQNPTVVTLLVLPVSTPSMTKRFNPTTVWAGQITDMEIDLTNTDSQNGLTGATYTDTLPGDFVLASPLTKSLTGTGCTGTIGATVGGKTVSLINGVVPKGTTCTVHVNVVSSTQGVYTNAIPAGPNGTGSLQTNQFVTNVSNVTAPINVQAMVMTKVFNPASFAQGDTSTLTITLRNPTSSPYTGMGFDDILPGALVVAGTPAASQCSGAVTISPDKKTISLNNGVVPPGTSTNPGSCTVVVQVTSPTAGGPWTNYIELADMRGIKPLSRVQSNNVTVVTRTIGVRKRFGADFIENNTSTLTITLSNTSSIAFTGVNFSDPLEGYPNISYVGTPTASSGCGANAVAGNTGQTLSIANAVIPAGTVGSPGTCVITATVTSSTPATYTNTLSAGAVCSAAQSICNAAGNSDGVVVYPLGGDALVSKSFDPLTVGPGSISSLTITIEAPSDTPLSQIYLRDNLPDDMVVVSVPNATPCGGTLSAPVGSQIIELSGGAIASANGTCTFSVDVTSYTPGTHANSIPGHTLTTYEGRTDPNNAQDSLTVNSFTGYKTFSPNVIAPGGLSLLTIFLTNSSLLPITNVNLTDNLADMDYAGEGYQVRVYNPGDPTFAPATDCGTNITLANDASVIGLTGATIPASDGVVPGLCRVNVYVKGLKTSGALRLRTNNISTGNISGEMSGVGTIHPRSFTGADLTIKPLSLNVDKGFNPTGVYNGSASLLTFLITNPNDVPLTGINFMDDMPDGMILATPTDFNEGTCGGTLAAHQTDPTIFYFSGGSLPALGTCQLTLKVTSTVSGTLINPIPAGSVSSFEGAKNPQDINETLGNATSALIAKSFSPNPVGLGSYSLLTIKISNVNTLITLNGMNLDDTLPTGLKIADPAVLDPDPPAPTTTCLGSLTADPDTDLIRLVNGILPPSTVSPEGIITTSFCTIQVAVIGPAGTYRNVIAAESLVTTEGDTNRDPAEDTLVVTSYSLGNRVWNDNGTGSGGVANDGLLNGSEPGLSGVTIRLYRDTDNNGSPDGGVIATKSTDSNGYYRFDDLMADNYIVEARIPIGYAVSAPNAGDPDITQEDDDNNGVDTASNPGYVRSNSVTLSGTDEPFDETNPTPNPDTAGGEGLDKQSNRTVDFGFYSMPFSLGNRIWDDQNGDGIQGAGEPGLSGVTVRLYRDNNTDNTPDGTALDFMTTDGDGYYRFDNLYADSYIVEVVTPAGYRLTTNGVADPNSGGPGNIGIDLDNNGFTVFGLNVRSHFITLGPDANEPTGETDPALNPNTSDGETPDAQSNRTLDFGFSASYSLGNRVWNDNGAGGGTFDDGIQNGSEPGLGGVVVNLLDQNGSPVDGNLSVSGVQPATTITDGGGYYRFDGLVAGDYIVEVIYPTGYGVSLINGGDPDNDIVNDNNGAVGVIGGVRSSLVTLGGGNEPTAEDSPTFTIDPSTNPMTGEAPDDFSNRTVDFGLYHLPLNLGNLVWLDNGAGSGGSANDGFRNGSEPGLGGVTVKLYRVGFPNSLAFTETDVNGNYSFTGLTAGDYTVEVTIPTGYTNGIISFNTPNDATDDDNNGSSLTGTQLSSSVINLTTDNLRVDFGLVTLASLGDRVWYDTNRDGVQDGGEVGVTGITVKLYTGTPGSGTLLATKTTGGGGYYNFSNLTPRSDYYLEFTKLANYNFSEKSPPKGGTTTTDSDVTDVGGNIGRTGAIGLSAFQNDTSWDAGIYLPPSSIGDVVWNDADRNGIQDGGELGVSGVIVELYRPGIGADGIAATSDDFLPVAAKTTDSNGSYSFTELPPGTYYVDFNLPDGYAFTAKNASGSTSSNDSDADTTSGLTANIVLGIGIDDPTWDAGLYQLSSIGDLVWDDKDGDGIQDGGSEAGVGGVLVNLYDSSDAIIGTTSTGSDGKYQFANLEPGVYHLGFIPPAGWTLSPKDAPNDTNTNDTNDSDADPDPDSLSFQLTAATTLIGGENDLSWDLGIYHTASIGDKVWVDNGAGGGVQRDGIQNGSEPGLAGVLVTLYKDGTSTGLTRTTASDGLYSFTGLLEGNYSVHFQLPADYQFSGKDQGTGLTQDDTDSDVNPGSGLTDATTLSPGENDPTWDAGAYLQPASLGDYVWHDGNGNGIQNIGEAPFPNINVTLYDALNQVVATTISGVDGKYLFNSLSPGYYYVGFTAPANYNFTLTGQGTSLTDSDAVVPLGKTNLTLLDPGENDMTWDSGLYAKASFGNFVWLDWNADGVQDSGEPGINGVSVELFRVGAGSIATTTTANSGLNPGFYLFDNLVPGDYYVVFTLPAGYVFSPQGSGSTAADSNPDAAGETAPVSLDSGDAELTVDAGLIPVFALGNRVWFDTDNDGSIDPGTELGAPSVRVQLYKSDGTTEVLVGPDGILNTSDDAAGGMLTDASGYYLFNNLPAGNYKVILPSSNFSGVLNGYWSSYSVRNSSGNVIEAGTNTANSDLDSDDNGGFSSGRIESSVVTLGLEYPAAEPLGETDLSAGGQGGRADNLANMTVDFGFYTVTLGNQVWDDNGAGGGIVNDGLKTGTEPGIQNVDVQLWSSNGSTILALLAAGSTDASGLYAFTGLSAGDYIIRVPANEFTGTATLVDYRSSTGGSGSAYEPAPDSDLVTIDSDDNGQEVNGIPGLTGYIQTKPITLTAGNEGSVTQSAGLTTENRVDFGLYNPQDIITITKTDNVSIVAPGTTLTYDINLQNEGDVALTTLTVTDTLPADATFVSANPAPTSHVGNIITWDTTTIPGLANLAVNGSISFEVVVIVKSSPSGTTITNAVEARDSLTRVTDNTSDTDNIATANVKSLTATEAEELGSDPPSNPEPVMIGEILTYTTRLDIPNGIMLNLTAEDVMDRGLAFVRCVSVQSGSLTTDLVGGFDAACNNSNPASNPLVSAEPVSATDPIDQGRRVLFNFGNVANGGAASQIIIVTYEAIVLNIDANVNGAGDLNNQLTWKWNTDSVLYGQADPVSIREPRLEINKSAAPSVAPFGTPITFTLDIQHTTSSSAPAYDVIVIDRLPAGLRYVQGSATITGLAPTSFEYEAVTTTLRFKWDLFPLSSTSKISFKAEFNGPSPVTNETNVEWTSMEIDPGSLGSPQQRSIHNIHSTERWYDPADSVDLNNYGAGASVLIFAPPLPKTGFTPGIITEFGPQPADLRYSDQGDLWLEFPKLKVTVPIVGVPLKGENGWDLTWLSNKAGWLEGTAYPSHPGNSVITAHVYGADGAPGPFIDLNKLYWGNQVILHINGLRYIYEVRGSRILRPDDKTVFKHEEYSWLTLITCKDYVESSDTYSHRLVVRAVLVRIE